MTRPLHFWVQHLKGKYRLRRGENLLRQGDVAAAIAEMTEALSRHPFPCEIYLQRGIAYLQHEAYELAATDFDQAIALSPQDARPYSYRGLLKYHLGDEGSALEDWAIALSLNPGNAVVRYNRGLVFAQKEQYDDALADFDIALEKNPLLAEAYLHRGKVKLMLGLVSEAVDDWELALCNDLRLDEARRLLTSFRENTENNSLQQQFQDLLPDGCSLAIDQRDLLLELTLHRPVGTPVNYFKLPNAFRERLVKLQIPGVRRFRLIARAGESSLCEWDQTYGIYDKASCPPSGWRAAFATTLLLFPPFGVVALVLASQVEPAYRRGDYPIAARASQAVKKLFLSSGAIMGLMLFGLASYGIHTYVEGEYPNPGAKTATIQKPDSLEEKL